MARQKKQTVKSGGGLYRLTVTEKQLRVIQTALEWFFRLQMGQFFDYVTEIAACGYVYDKNRPNNAEEFDRYIRTRNDSQAIFETAYRVAHPRICDKTDAMLAAEDIWRVIRYHFWQKMPEPKDHYTVDAYPPLFLSADGQKVKIEEVQE